MTRAALWNTELGFLFHYDNFLDPSICAFSFYPRREREMSYWATEASTTLVKRYHNTTTSPFWLKSLFLAKKCTTWIGQWLQFSSLLRFWKGSEKCLFLLWLHLECFKTLYFSLQGSILTAVGGCHPHNWLQNFLQALAISPMANLAASNLLQISCSHELTWLTSKVNTKTL